MIQQMEKKEGMKERTKERNKKIVGTHFEDAF